MVLSAIRRTVRERILFPIAGRVLDHYFQWIRDIDGWERVVSAAAHTMVESLTAVGARALVAEAVRDIGPYLGQDSIEVLRIIDEVARKHSPEAN